MTSVKDFGATGDGMADDTASIQHAIEQGDGHIVFPRGSYRLRKTIEIPLKDDGPIALSGEGATARLIMTGPGPALRFVGTHDKSADPNGFRAQVWLRERMPTLSGLEIVGDHDQADGISLEGTMEATILGVLIRRCRYGVHLVKRNRNLLISSSHLYHGRPGGIGVYFDHVDLHQSIIVGSHISYFPHAGIKVIGSQVRNLQITGCDIEYNFDVDHADSADVWIDAHEGAVREGTIASNTIQAKNSPKGSNVRMEGADVEGSKQVGLFTITGNILQSQAVNLWLKSCRGVIVTGNSFASGYERSIVLDRCRHIVIGSNAFDHNPDYEGDRVDGITIRSSAGCSLSNLILESTRSGDAGRGGAIEVFDSSEIAITGCQILDPEHRGIELENVSNSRVSDCTILDRRRTRVMRHAIRLRGNGLNNVIHNNLVDRGLSADLALDEGSASALGNIIRETDTQ